jgi:hypothetical protein
MRIAIDARELHGKPTGVGRFLGELLDAWKMMPEGQGHEFVLLAPEGATSDGGTLWEQMVLPRLARDAGAGVLFAPAYSGPVLPPVPMVLAIHDVSFAAHPEWFAWREGARRRSVVQLAARAATRVITISQFSKREIVAHLGIETEKIVVVYPGVADLSAITPRRTADSVSSAARTLRVREGHSTRPTEDWDPGTATFDRNTARQTRTSAKRRRSLWRTTACRHPLGAPSACRCRRSRIAWR